MKSSGGKDSAPHTAGRRAVAGDYFLSTQLLLNKCVGERLFRFVVGDAFTINVMGHLVNQNVVQVEPAQVVKGVAGAETEWMSTKENTGIPIHAVTPQVAGP